MKKIGFIGLGHMGMPMALQLLKQNYPVCGYDMNIESVSSFQQQGGQPYQNLKYIAQNSDVMITMLPSAKPLLELYQPENEFIQFIKPNTLLIDCSTVGPIGSIQWHQIAKKFNLRSVDAPVSGGVMAANNGNLSFMIGGEEHACKDAQSILQALGHNFIFTGGAGSGQVAKVCNNLVLANNMIAISEAFTLAQALNLEPQKFLEVLQCSSGNSWVVEKYLPIPDLIDNVPANNDYKAGFSGYMMLKDLNLALDALKQTQLQLSLTEESQRLFEEMVKTNNGEKDFSYIFEFINKITSKHAE
jgi:3-hydroxyisobutyrate dehydrogenase